MRVWFVACLSACGFTPSVIHSDAASEGPIEAGSDAAIMTDCIDKWFATNLHFSSRHHLDALATQSSERDPTLSHDELTIWFASDRGGIDEDVYAAKRTSIGAPFGTPMPHNVVNTQQDETKFAVSDNELSYAIASDRVGSHGGYDIFVSHRPNVGMMYPPADNAKLNSIDDAGNQFDPWIDDDATTLYYAPVGAGQKIFRATRPNESAQFGAPAAVDEINIGTLTADPTLFADQRVIVFSAIAPDNIGGLTNTDLWYATRASAAAQFDPPIHIADLSTANFEGDPWVSSDGCRIYFAGSTNSDYDLYEADVL